MGTKTTEKVLKVIIKKFISDVETEIKRTKAYTDKRTTIYYPFELDIKEMENEVIPELKLLVGK